MTHAAGRFDPNRRGSPFPEEGMRRTEFIPFAGIRQATNKAVARAGLEAPQAFG